MTSAVDAENVALEIRRDVIDPALNDISLRLRRAEESLRTKHLVSIGLSSLSIACGLLGDASLAAGLFAAAVAGAGVIENKGIEDRKEVSLSDMYFLWKASQLGNPARSIASRV